MKQTIARSVVLVSLLLSLAATAAAQTAGAAPAAGGDSGAEVDKLFAQWDKPDAPGYAVAVVKDGRVVHARGYGMADLERDVRLTPKSVFDIGSTSKQFTAASVLMLARQGKLSLDDDARKHIPELRRYEHPFTIRHLLHHTSGVRDYLTLMRLAGLSERNDYPDAQVVGLIARQESLNFKPGDEHLYSNSGYYLLGEIVRRAGGKSLREFADENIFRPLGMKNTHFHDDTSVIVRNRALGYSPRPGGGHHIDMSIFHVVGDGALHTTIEDLALWDAFFYDPTKLTGGADLLRDMITPGKLNSGEALTYAAGLGVDKYKGLARISHGGAWAGYRADMVRFPDQRLTVICLANFGAANPTELAHKVADIYLAGQIKSGEPAAAGARPEPKYVQLTARELEDKTGLYHDAKAGIYRRIQLREGKLFYVRGPNSESELGPLASDRFRMLRVPSELIITFKPSGAGARPRMEVVTDGGKPTIFEPVESFAPTPAQLGEYAGDYYSEELGATHRLRVKDGKLVWAVGDDPEELAAEPTVRDEFVARGVQLRFKRDAQNRVGALAVGAGRVKNIAFVRKPSR